MDKRKVDEIVTTHVLWSMGAGLVPIPLLDIAAVTGIQLDLLKQLATAYGVPYREDEGKVWLSALTGSLAARLGANVLKLLPGIGSLVGGVSMAIMSGASTYAISRVAIDHFERSGTFSNLDLDAARKTYEQEFEVGKRKAEDLKNRQKDSKDVFDKLERLGKLRQEGVITEAEFDEQKRKLLDAIV